MLDPACTVYGEMENAFRSVLDAMDEMKRLERQMAECPGDHMLLERHAQLSAVVDAADGYNMDTQIKKILNGMAFPAPDYQKSVAVLSGGEDVYKRQVRKPCRRRAHCARPGGTGGALWSGTSYL